MKSNEYKFKIGDRVITVYGEVGQITGICTCESCEKRGFFEPVWVADWDTQENYITVYDAQTGFKEFYQIGEYRFNKFDREHVTMDIAVHEDELKQLYRQLQTIDELEGAKGHDRMAEKLKRSDVFIFSCINCDKTFWVTEDMCYPQRTSDGRRILDKCPACGHEGWLFEICRGAECDWDLGEEVEEAEYLFYCSRCDTAFRAKTSECGEDSLHNVTHECVSCGTVVRVLQLADRYREAD